ncbi:MAG: phosphatidylglycerophosphatase A [Candidatus Eisenbacteria bacterium]|nr:phosphatidylglycerophosphatase A [Candidatus Eisenbacteria bacterium]
MKSFARFLATLGPTGSAPIAPATAGSALVAACGWFIPPPALPVTIALLVVATAIAVWAAGEAEKQLGRDASPIVIDEAIGQSLALLFVPHTIPAFALSFVLFRIFDIWKPLGAREIQALPGGLGVVADDVIAGFTACGVFHLIAFALHRTGLHAF